MSVVEAALVAAWIAILLMALALAGVLRQLKDLQERLWGGTLGQPARRVPDVLRPRAPAQATLVLSVDEGCQVCHDVAPAFAAAARAVEAGHLDFVVLSDATSPRWPASERVRTVVDPAARRDLGVLWTPALVTVGRDGSVEGIDPAGSEAAVRKLVSDRAGSATRRAALELRNGEGGSQ